MSSRGAAPGQPAAHRSPLQWLFENRGSGKITVAQFPNVPLAIFLLTVAVRAFGRPRGTAGLVVGAAASISLAWWSLGEIVHGVNPFRRGLGATVLTGMLASIALG